jgi:two-component system osmolarity sensor histidine kinase EnvZ
MKGMSSIFKNISFKNLSLSRFMPSSLAARFMLIITIPLIAAQLIGIYIFYVRHWYNVSSSMSHITANELRIIVSSFASGRTSIAEEIAKTLQLDLSFYPHQKLLPNNSLKREEFYTFQEIIERRIPWRSNVRYSKNQNVITTSFELPKGVLEISMTTKRVITPTTMIFVSWVFGITLLFLLMSLIFTKNQIRSIIELAKAADGFGKGISYDFKPSGAKEIRMAGIAFIKMRERIERQIAKRTQMLAMISHDLKTPLTRMKFQLELLPQSEEIEEMANDVVDMQHIIDSYLDFARGEGGEDYQKFDMAEFVKGYIDSINWGKIDIKFGRVSKNLHSNLKPQAFKRAIANIINNAEKYAAKLQVSIYKKGENIIIDIDDNGSGIPDNEKGKVFKPFYRSDNARNISNSSSVGLGLAITKEIIMGHNGIVSLYDSKALGGLQVKIILPMIE